MNGRRRALFAGVAALNLAAAAGPALAQDTPGATLEELIVTAEKREQNLQEVPASITAFSQADIRTRDIESIGDVVRQVPNVSFGEIGFGTQISSRGIGTSLITGLGESSVAVYVDGVYLSRPSMASLLQKDLGRVEFLRGPQGTLYGRNATGGVLNMISPTPSKTFSGGATIGVGNYKTFSVAADVGGPLGDKVRGRLFVSSDTHDGYTQHILGTQELDALRTYGGRASLDADLSERATAELRLVYQKEHSTGPVFKPLQGGIPIPASSYSLDPFKASPNVPANRNRELFSATGRLNLDLDDVMGLGAVRLSSITGYIRYVPDVISIDADGTSVNLFSNTVYEHDRQFTQEFNAVHAGDQLDWTLGAFFMKERVRADRLTDVPGFAALGLRQIGYLTDMKATSASVFADATFHPTERLQLFAGVRGTWERRRQEETSFQTLTTGVTINRCTPLTPLGNLSRNDDAVTGRVGAKYDLGATNLYVQASKGYKSGGFGYSTCGNTFQPEKLDAIEVGAKSLVLEQRLRLNASAFYYDLKNLQVEQIQTVGSAISSVPKSRIYGAELEADWLITSRLRANFSGGLLNAEYVRFFDIDSLNTAAGRQDLSGKKLNRSPKWSASYGLQYEQPLTVGSLLFRTDVRSTARFTLRPANTPGDFQKGYTLVDGSVSYISPGDTYRLRAWVKNLTKEAYLQGLFSTVTVNRVGTFGAPRTLGLDLTARF